MEQVLLWGSIIVVIVGALGTIVPLLPGTPLIFGTALLYGFYEGFVNITLGSLVLLGVLMGITFLVDYFSGTLGAKKYGATKYGSWGSLIGGVIGFIFLNLPGLVIGPLVGAVAGELYAGKQISDASRVGFGTLVGIALGSAVKFSIALAMAAIYISKLL